MQEKKSLKKYQVYYIRSMMGMVYLQNSLMEQHIDN